MRDTHREPFPLLAFRRPLPQHLVTFGNRNADLLSNLHQIPATASGGYPQYSRTITEFICSVQVGIDLLQIQAVDRVRLFSAPSVSPSTLNGFGNQLVAGAFG